MSEGAKEGYVLVDKPAGISSFGVVGAVRRALGIKKAGHCGTLDPAATGLMVVLCGGYTKLQSVITDKDKTYTGTIKLGTQTNTDDAEGEPCEVLSDRKPIELLTRQSIDDAMRAFVGPIAQVPPQFSAISIGGKRAYKSAREGRHIDLPPRNVEVYRFDVTDWRGDEVDFEAHVSKGTYIRSLARDLGLRLETYGHLKSLRRTQVGHVSCADATTIEALTAQSLLISDLGRFYLPQQLHVSAQQAIDLGHGKKICVETEKGQYIAIHGERLIALVDVEKGIAKVRRGLNILGAY